MEVLSVLHENDITPKVPVDLIVFAEEEGVTFGLPLAGSKALTGRLTLDDMKVRKSSTDGRSLYETANYFGLDPDSIPSALIQPGEVAAMIELHIEQCITLERDRIQIGIIEKIAGSYNYLIEVEGVANHAGATPMRLRQDALVGAAVMVQQIDALAQAAGRDDAVATVGRFAVLPNTPNVIPNRVIFTIDLRDTDMEICKTRLVNTLVKIEQIATQRNLRVTAKLTGNNAPIALSSSIANVVEKCAKTRGYSYKIIHSGALHDTAVMGELAPSCMLFVPSREGRSHSPEEFTDQEDIRRGVQLLVDTVINLAC